MKRKIIDTLGFLLAVICLLFPYYDKKSFYNALLQEFSGTIKSTKTIPGPEDLNYFWIDLDCGNNKIVTFMIETYPQRSEQILSLRENDHVTIYAEGDVLERGHYFPHKICRGKELIIDQSHIQQYRAKSYKKIKIVGILLLIIVFLEVVHYQWKARRDSAKAHLPPAEDEDSDGRWEEFYDAKHAALERVLGPMDNIVGHAVIPFFVGGALDIYYFSSHIPGTVIATMELIGSDGKGPKPNRLGLYELVTCTRLDRPPADSGTSFKPRDPDNPTAFDIFHQRMWMTLTRNMSSSSVSRK